jgi:hypothetical protein
MDLKFRRNLPLLLLFAATVAVLVLGLGSQPIIAYTFEADGEGESPSATNVDLVDGTSALFDLTTTESADIIAPISDTTGSFETTSFVGTDSYPAEDQETAVNLEGSVLSTFQ